VDTEIVVSGLAITPVKSTRLHTVERVRLERSGVRENRRFFLIDERNRMVNGKHLGVLSNVVADYDDDQRRLKLTLPDGRVLEDEIRVGDPIQTRFYSRVAVARLLEGSLSAAFSELAGQPLRLVEASEACGAVDRGSSGSVSLISRASLARLAEAGGARDVDGRRFRMLIEVDGVRAHAEDDWVHRTVQIGEALVAFGGHVGRCLVTSRNPETGAIDLPTLDILGTYRRELQSTEPLPFGIYGGVAREGTIRVGDAVVAVN
jgi:uncharacterized protein YcbX